MNLDAAVAVTLSDGANHLTADFGFNGRTAIGDRVWWDRNGDGRQDTDEPGLRGVQVTTTYAGPNGTFGDGDDLVFVSTTDDAGEYVVENAPEGIYTVAITGGVPDGMAVSYDEDDGPTAANGVTALTLGPAPHLTADFGIVGAGSLAGVVWLDANSNGGFDGDEVGIPSVTVNPVWAGPDGPVTLTVITTADGSWSLGRLPAGTYAITPDQTTVPEASSRPRP